jgi:hypothetical protein
MKMKKVNKTVSAVALGLGLASAAHAQVSSGYTPIFITGSTAFRAQIFAALTDLGLTVQQSGTSGNNSFTFQGTVANNAGLGLTFLSAGTKLEVLCDFSGSAEGIQTIIQSTPTTYLNAGASGAGSFTQNGADFAFSDVAQASTPVSPSVTGVTLKEIQTAADAASAPFTGMAVQPFTFAVNKTAANAGINNITPQQFLDLYRVGTLDECFFTGVAPGSAKVTAVGRYNLSGTRITSILDDGGLTANSLVQYALSPGSGQTPGLHNGDSSAPTGSAWVNVGNDGYFTGGNVGLALANGASAPAAIGYIGFSDAQGKFGTSGAVPIKWQGENPGALGAWNITGLENGSYGFFTYERLYENPADVGTSYDSKYGPDLITAIQYEITHASPQTADIEANMQVYRNADGGDLFTY